MTQKSSYFFFICSCARWVCIHFGAAYPGFMSPDSIDQFTQAKTGIYTN